MERIRKSSRLVQFFLEKIGAKLDYHKLKKLVDFGFVLTEKLIVNLDKLHFIYLDIYDDMIENEINLADISKDKFVLHIGCGAIPATSILLTKKTGSQVKAIDNDLKAVKKAILYVNKTGFSKKIQIEHADAKNYPVEKFDTIIISQGVKPIKDILEHIYRSMKDDAYVIFRTSSSPSGEIAKNDLFIKDKFNIDNLVAQKKNALLISILLKKRLRI